MRGVRCNEENHNREGYRMKKVLLAGIVATLLATVQVANADPHRLGLGVRYYLSSIINQISAQASDGELEGMKLDDSGLSWLVTYQYRAWKLVGFEADLEMIPESTFPGLDTIWMPQLYVIVGSGLYAAAGVGLPFSDGDAGDDVVWNLRAGLDVDVIDDMIHLDLNANYGFSDFDQLSEFSMDYMTVGAAVRYEF